MADLPKDDELLEVTPKSMRLRKRHLSIIERKKHARKEARAAQAQD